MSRRVRVHRAGTKPGYKKRRRRIRRPLSVKSTRAGRRLHRNMFHA